MALRVTVTETADLTVIRVDGRVAGTVLAELEATCRQARRPAVLDLTNLVSADDAGVLLLRQLAEEGLHLVGASPYTVLLLNWGRPSRAPAGPPAAGRREQPSPGSTSTPRGPRRSDTP